MCKTGIFSLFFHSFLFVQLALANTQSCERLLQPGWRHSESRIVQRLLDLPTRSIALRKLEKRWQALEVLKGQIRWLELKDETFQEVRDEINELRMELSSTLRGDRLTETFDWAQETQTARENWVKVENLLYKWIKAGRELDGEAILALNESLCTGLRNNDKLPGKIRNHALNIDGEGYFIHSEDAAYALEEFVAWYHRNKSQMHPIEFAARAYQRLVSYHPFSDGNGRTSRAVMDWILLKNGYPPAAFVSAQDGVVAIFVEPNQKAPSPEAVVNTLTQAIENTFRLLLTIL